MMSQIDQPDESEGDTEPEFAAALAEMKLYRPSRADRKKNERATQRTKAQRARGQSKRDSVINIRCSDAFKARVAAAAKKLKGTDPGMSATDIIEAAVVAYLTEKGL
jgi:hypothetical protein